MSDLIKIIITILLFIPSIGSFEEFLSEIYEAKRDKVKFLAPILALSLFCFMIIFISNCLVGLTILFIGLSFKRKLIQTRRTN